MKYKMISDETIKDYLERSWKIATSIDGYLAPSAKERQVLNSDILEIAKMIQIEDRNS